MPHTGYGPRPWGTPDAARRSKKDGRRGSRRTASRKWYALGVGGQAGYRGAAAAAIIGARLTVPPECMQWNEASPCFR